MNDRHLVLCASTEWFDAVRNWIVPWAVEGVDLGDDVLEIGPGPGATTAVLHGLVRRLTVVEIDGVLADRLVERYQDNPGVDVVQADATETGLPGGRFDSAVCLTMLHHVPGAAEQNALFAEAFRLLRPGGVFLGSDSLDGPEFRELHEGDICVPVDPATLDARLAEAGFVDVRVETNEYAVRFRAHTPA
jgi:SAM-dependent methyltransferase